MWVSIFYFLECDVACKECTGPTPFNCTECAKGFKEDDDNACKGKTKQELKMVWIIFSDIDECAELEKTDCLKTEFCNNIPGGYECGG